MIFAPHRQSNAKSELLASLEGRGTCKNRFQADTCRKRAADGIIRCARDLWAIRNTHTLPPTCTEERGDSFARIQVEGIFVNLHPNSVLDRARFAACCKFNQRALQMPAELWVIVTGDRGCVSDTSSPSHFETRGDSPHAVDENAVFDCAKARANGICRR